MPINHIQNTSTNSNDTLSTTTGTTTSFSNNNNTTANNASHLSHNSRRNSSKILNSTCDTNSPRFSYNDLNNLTSASLNSSLSIIDLQDLTYASTYLPKCVTRNEIRQMDVMEGQGDNQHHKISPKMENVDTEQNLENVNLKQTTSSGRLSGRMSIENLVKTEAKRQSSAASSSSSSTKLEAFKTPIAPYDPRYDKNQKTSVSTKKSKIPKIYRFSKNQWLLQSLFMISRTSDRSSSLSNL